MATAPRGRETMAQDWLKMRKDLREDPAVIRMAAMLKVEEDVVVGKLHRLWSWVDSQLAKGNGAALPPEWIDRYINVLGFADALLDVGWLEVDAGLIVIPRFERYFAQSAKQRALTAVRVEKSRIKTRTKKRNASSLHNREEKRREEVTPLKSPKGDASTSTSPYTDAFLTWWTAYPRRVGKAAAFRAHQKAAKRVRDEHGISPAEAHTRILEAATAFAGTPKAKGDFCPHPSTWLNQGRYDDDPATWQDAGDSRGKRPVATSGRVRGQSGDIGDRHWTPPEDPVGES